MSTKTCIRCEKVKPLDQFNRCTTHFGGDGYTKACKECTALLRAERRAAATDTPPQEEVEPDPNRPRLAVPMCMAVGVEYDGDDFVLTQQNEDEIHTIYLAPHALRRIWEFAQELASKQQAAAAQPVEGGEPE